MQVQLEKIPQYLKDNDQFCNWRYELRDGNQTKVPYMSGTRRKANVDDPTTFTAFDTAASATGYDGIGICVSGRIVGIDLDHCMEDGKLLPWAQTIVDRFDATYIEISPSGEGIRIFCLLPSGFEYDTQTCYIKKGNIEVYIPGHTNRFLTVTGNTINGADVAETAESLVWLLDTYMRRPTPPTPAVAVPGESYLNDEAVIAKASAAQNGEKFRRLWDGDITGYKSQSEADAALVASLAFWCSGDRAQMDRLFRQFGLMREKWDSLRGSDTYGNISIIMAQKVDQCELLHCWCENVWALLKRPTLGSRENWPEPEMGTILVCRYQPARPHLLQDSFPTSATNQILSIKYVSLADEEDSSE